MTDTVLDTISTSATLTMNGTVPGSIDPPPLMAGSSNTTVDHDWFQVTLAAGQTYTFGAAVTSGLSTDYLGTAAIDLRNQSGTLISGTLDDSVAPTFTYTPTAPGTYFLAISAGGNDTASQTFEYSISVLQGSTAPGSAVVDPFVPYADQSPGTPNDVVAAAQQYVGKLWAWDNCTGLVWAIATEVGGAFYETVNTVTGGLSSTIPSILPDDGYVLPTAGITYGNWQTYSEDNWQSFVQIGDVVRIPGSQLPANGGVGHSFVVVGKDISGNWQVIDDTEPGHITRLVNSDHPVTISEHTFTTPGDILYSQILAAKGVLVSRLTGSTPCFCRGTLIATPHGEVPVEKLSAADLVMTLNGTAQPIVWIGNGRVLVTPGHRSPATPVIVRKGALADNVPHRDLHVTKGHSLFIGGALIPVEFLVNHRSIIWDDRAKEIEIYHIELAQHAVLIADGAPAESYRDDGNRWLFRNANTGWHLPPQEACAPVFTGGPIVDAIWRRLLNRAGPRPGLPTTDDPDLHVLVDGKRVDGKAMPSLVHVFQLRQCPSAVRIVSRSASPQELGLARDPRELGVALRRIIVRKGTQFRIIEVNDARLSEGFHTFESDNGFRWTDGDAAVPAEFFAGFTGPLELVLCVDCTTQYPLFCDVRHNAA